MFSKEEASARREAFWTALGRYMAPIQSASGERVNWVAYKTGEKGVQFKMEAEGSDAFICIELNHPEDGVRELQYLQMGMLKGMLEAATGEAWNWTENLRVASGKTVSRIGVLLPNVSVFRQEDWPSLIQFFKPRLIALDWFWTEAKYAFETLHE